MDSITLCIVFKCCDAEPILMYGAMNKKYTNVLAMKLSMCKCAKPILAIKPIFNQTPPNFKLDSIVIAFVGEGLDHITKHPSPYINIKWCMRYYLEEKLLDYPFKITIPYNTIYYHNNDNVYIYLESKSNNIVKKYYNLDLMATETKDWHLKCNITWLDPIISPQFDIIIKQIIEESKIAKNNNTKPTWCIEVDDVDVVDADDT